MNVIFGFIYALTNLLFYVIIAQIIMFWLLQLGIISMRTDFVSRLWNILNAILEPIYQPIRRYVPPLGNIDTAPLVLVLGILIVQSILRGFMWG